MRFIRRQIQRQEGITGLETAIILIAFVVVASVFAYSVLSAGLFTSERSKEAAIAGVDQATNTIELVGDVKADGMPLTTLSPVDGTAGWSTATDVTAATETADYKQGTAGISLAIGAAFTTGLVAWEDLSSTVDLSGHFSAGLWIKSDTAIGDGVLQLVLDDSAGCGSPEESLSLPALSADEWVSPRIQLTDPTALAAVACVGLSATSDPGAVTLHVDHIQGPPEIQALHVAMGNSVPTRGITFITTPDSNSDGLLSDEISPAHHMIVSYSSNDVLLRDLAWSITEVGSGDGDADLEAGETFILSVDLRAVDPIPTERSLVRLHIAAHDDASLVLERLAPSKITSSMVLR